MHSKCPICDAQLNIDDTVEVAEIISCNDCKNKLEVISKTGKIVNVKEAPKVEEDWGE